MDELGFQKTIKNHVLHRLWSFDEHRLKEIVEESGFFQDRERFFKKLSLLINPNEEALFAFVSFAYVLRTTFEEEGISEQIYMDTMREVAIWSAHYYAGSGMIGIAQWDWLCKIMDRKVLRLGRLEFEKIQLEKDYPFKGGVLNAGTPALSVHIPEGEPMTPDACKDSFAQAKRFFSEEYRYCYCYSWLLETELRKLLPEESNIICFQRLFTVVETIRPHPMAIERVFGEVSEDAGQYAEKTCLQRSLKQHLLSGNQIGIGVGICELEDCLK